MGIREKLQAVTLFSVITCGTGFFYIKGRTRKVHSIPGDDATSYCATLIDQWRAEEALKNNYLFAYEVQTVVPNVKVAKRLFGAMERKRELCVHANGAKEVQTRLIKVKPSPLLGSLYALQSLHRAELLRSQRALHVFAETLRVSNVFYLWWSGTQGRLREVRNDVMRLLPSSSATSWIEDYYEELTTHKSNNKVDDSIDINNERNKLEEECVVPSTSRWRQVWNRVHLRKAKISNNTTSNPKNQNEEFETEKFKNTIKKAKKSRELSATDSPTERVEGYCRELSELGMDHEVLAIPAHYEAVIRLGGHDAPVVGVSLSPTPPNPRLHPFTPTRVVTAHVFYAAPIHPDKYVQRAEYWFLRWYTKWMASSIARSLSKLKDE